MHGQGSAYPHYSTRALATLAATIAAQARARKLASTFFLPLPAEWSKAIKHVVGVSLIMSLPRSNKHHYHLNQAQAEIRRPECLATSRSFSS